MAAEAQAAIADFAIEVEEVLVEAENGTGSSTTAAAVAEAEELLGMMKLELHSIKDKTIKTEIQTQMAAFTKRCNKLKQAELLGDADEQAARAAKPQSKEDAEEASLARLQQARQQLAETEDVATGIVGNLAEQKETINRSKDNLKETNKQLTYSNSLLNKMGKWWRG